MIDGTTHLLAILADPVAQTRTPALVNAELSARGCNAALLPFHVDPAGLPELVRGLRATKNFRGAVVTMPHKQAILPLLDDLTPAAAAVRACNVIRREAADRMVGDMLDGAAVVRGLQRAGSPVDGRTVFLAGAGGAAAGIAFALAGQGVGRLRLYNRTAPRAEDLAARLRRTYPAVDVSVGPGRAHAREIAINATSVGMRPDDPPPFALADTGVGATAVDMVVNPRSALASLAEERGYRVIRGVEVLTVQTGLLVDFMLAGAGTSTGIGAGTGAGTAGGHRGG